MINEPKYEELDGSISRVISGAEFVSTGDEELDVLARLASGLRGLPDPHFETSLKEQLMSRADESPAASGALPFINWFKQHRAFAAAGASSGLVGGACCVTGAVASVFGLASAAAVSSYIDSTLPFFIALSLVTLLTSLALMLREQGVTMNSLALTVRRHGLAVGGAYGVVFGASMALTMAMGLY